MFSDGLPRYLKHGCPGVVVALPDGTCIEVLGYGEDFGLVATSIEDSQLSSSPIEDLQRLTSGAPPVQLRVAT